MTTQCEKPTGWVGRFFIWLMNHRHSQLTDWGLRQVRVDEHATVLDVGCGGGRTVGKLAMCARNGTVHGVDHARASVLAARSMNRELIDAGRVRIEEASVSELPYADATFDLVTAVETHFWWRDLGAGMRETYRVLKPGGSMVVIVEFYNGGKHARYADRLRRHTTMAVMDIPQHEAMFTDAGFTGVRPIEEPQKGWLCVIGMKPE